MGKSKGCRVGGWNPMQLSREELEGDTMQVGDLVKENPDNALFYGETFGIIINVDGEIATVAWVCHPVFGTHENYCTAKELIFFNKNT
jgi:hypothetical protein